MLREANLATGLGFTLAGIKDYLIDTFAWAGLFLILGVAALYIYYQYKVNGNK
jgi:hypothetical protein